MGKSPGKWIKTLLFGKKASRSNALKGKETSKATNEKERWITGRGSATDSPLISHPFPDPTDRNGQNSDLDNRVASGLPCDEEVALPVSQGEGKPERSDGSGVFTDPEKSRQEKAAIKAQAAFRGYLARRAFRALRGIIRLQALVRGHLVRRQAVAMLRCLQAIIRLQALVRGRRVRLSEIGMTVNKNFSEGKDGHPSNNLVVNTPIPVEKLLANAFACKLLASSPKAMPLLIQYPLEEPNSAWNWLVAWTSTRFWHPPSQPKKGLDSKHQTKLGASHASEIEPRRLKRIVRRNPLSSESGLTHFPSDPEKPKRNLRKILSHPVDPVQENPQNELDKVKRSLKKVSNSTAEGSSDRSEIDMEKPKRSVRKVISSTSVVPELGDGDATEKMKKNATETSPSQSNIKTGLKPLTIDGSVESLNNDHVEVDITPSESNGKDGNISIANGELSSKEDQTCPDNPKNCRRRASFPAKSDYVENGIQSNPTLPSYMATTESAKAKLRAQGSPRFGQDGVEKNGFTRRHSLPSSANGKVSSLSPRTQRLVQAGGKAGIRYDRSLLSSRDGNEKAIQIEWRR